MSISKESSRRNRRQCSKLVVVQSIQICVF